MRIFIYSAPRELFSHTTYSLAGIERVSFGVGEMKVYGACAHYAVLPLCMSIGRCYYNMLHMYMYSCVFIVEMGAVILFWWQVFSIILLEPWQMGVV